MHDRLPDPRLWRRLRSSKKVGIVAAYEDAATRNRVEAFCQTLALYHLPRTCKLALEPWLFNLLHSPKLKTIAAQDAAMADIVVISAHTSETLPAEVKEWIRSCLRHRGHHPVVVVTLLDPGVPGLENLLKSCLGKMARKPDVEVITRLAA